MATATKSKKMTTTAKTDDYTYRVLKARIQGVTPYTQGRAMSSEKIDKEGHDAYDERCWRERATYDQDGNVTIPAQALYLALISVCKFYNETIPGHGKKTWTARFTRGVILRSAPVLEPARQVEDLECQKVHVPSDGRVGGSTRVWRRFPIFWPWAAEVELLVTDRLIPDEVVERYLEQSGVLCGIGTYRRESRGTNGQYEMTSASWEHI